MNEIYKKLTTIKQNKLKFKKVLKKIRFPFSKVNFSLLENKILLKKRRFYYFRSHERSELPAHKFFFFIKEFNSIHHNDNFSS